jgi:protein ImuA
MPKPRRSDRASLLESLTEQLRALEETRWVGSGEVISTLSPALDRLLPAGGFRRGALVEWLSSDSADGAATLALLSARGVLADGGALVVIDRRRLFYPPAAARLGIALEKMIVVRPASQADQAWALDQALRSRGVAAVLCSLEKPDSHTLRRLQLAAETSGVVGLLLRPRQARHEPSWAELRLWVEPLARRPSLPGRSRLLRVELLRSRAGPAGGTVELEIPTLRETLQDRLHADHETRPVHLASQLAAAKTRRRPRRA